MHEPSNPSLLPPLARKTDTRILFVVLDGLGGVIVDRDNETALQRSQHPHLDDLARVSALGRTVVVADGITAGSGPGHFSIFGYDPLGMEVGRGLLEALGLGVDVNEGDVAIRGNLCELDSSGALRDRRAGRIPTETARIYVDQLREGITRIEDVEVEIHQGLQYRFAAVLRGPGLGGRVTDTDPQVENRFPLEARALDEASAKTARIVNAIGARAQEILMPEGPANGVILRGISGRPPLMTYPEMTKLSPVAIAAYPAYRGVARMLGMHVWPGVEATATIADEVTELEKAWKTDHDFFFLHVKGTDSAGEDGDPLRKAKVIEEFDAELPRIRALEPDVIVVTGDHSTPSPMAAHSWHPVPALLWGPWCEPDAGDEFEEEACHRGRLGGRFPATALLRMALANAGKLAKFGA